MGNTIDDSRIMLYFTEIGISNIILGKVNYTKSFPPLDSHIHKEAFEITYHCKGSQIYNIDNINYKIKGGDVFITFPNEQHSTNNHCEEKSIFYYLIFNLSEDTKVFLDFDENATTYLKMNFFNIKNRIFRGTHRLQNILHEIVKIFFTQHPLRKARVSGLLSEFFYEIINCFENNAKNESDDIEKVKDFIDKNPQIIHNIGDLSKMAHLSQSHFKQKFKEYIGIPPIEYSLRIKIDTSKKLLLEGSQSATKIAYNLGFSSSQHFSSVFKKYTNYTPKQFQKINR